MREVLLRRAECVCVCVCVYGCGSVNIYFETRQVLCAIGIEIVLWLGKRTRDSQSENDFQVAIAHVSTRFD